MDKQTYNTLLDLCYMGFNTLAERYSREGKEDLELKALYFIEELNKSRTVEPKDYKKTLKRFSVALAALR